MILGQFDNQLIRGVVSLLSLVNKYKIIPILRGMELEDARFLVDCFREADLKILEVSLNQPNSLHVLENLVKEFGDDMVIGAGTVLTKEIAIDAKNAGAAFFLSPNVSEQVADTAAEMGIPYIPGAFSPTEIQYASELGAEVIKVFPVRQVGASYIKDVLASLNKVSLLAVGGVAPQNMRKFFEAGVKGVGVGSSLVDQEWIEKRDRNKIIARLEEYKNLVHEN